MRIGIDIDDTAFITVNSMLKYADKYNKDVLGKDEIKNSFGLIKNRYYLKAIYGWNDEEKFGFFNMFYKNVLEECKPMPDVAEVCKMLKSEGNDIYFITARLNNIENCNTEEITKNSLEKNGILYEKLLINASNKLEAAKENSIDLFIEDSFETCSELLNSGIKSILMTTKMNNQIDAGSIPRVNNWKEVYDTIKNIENKSIR